MIEAADSLKVIGRAGIGLDNVDRETAKQKGIKVVNTPTATSISVAELALGMMFAAARRIAQATVSTKAGKWEKKKFKGFELYGKKLGIIGIGRIGTEVAKRAQALGMEVSAYDPQVQSSDYAKLVDLDTLLKDSDYITLHIPRTTETEHILNKGTFDKMKELVPAKDAEIVKDASIKLYMFAHQYARERNVIIADTKFEWGTTDGKIILIDEVLTPDSSRFWPADKYQPGRDQESFDKQFVRNYLESINFDKSGPGVELPPDIVQKTSDKYIEGFERLTGKKFSP